MAELQNQSTTAPDQLSSLYKMSRTAGLGTTEYVAINGAAVTAAILGVASSLAILDDVLLVIPIVGIIFGIVALRQIGQSNGTQGGRVLGWGGLVLSLGLAGIVIGGEAKAMMGHQADSKQIVGIIDELSADVKGANVDKAYALFSPQFRQRVDKDHFAGTMKMLEKSAISGELEYMRWNGVPFQFEPVPNQADRFAAATMLVKFSNSHEPFRTELSFRNGDEGWKIYNIPSLFPEQQQAPAGKQAR
ncbi:MAG TPA: DUF4190 domain-containing protein [Tepidisphaeraceae bacterium]|jgi:hypothetical protein|nr:DUF4190 domain-containing protein [Tepidisphaeraceae bacterium]